VQPITVLQHLSHEGPGVLADVLDGRGLVWRSVALHDGEPVPRDPRALGGLVVLGGDMNTDEEDRYPHLAEERRLLAACVDAGTPVLGLCLGAQLLAEAAGATVVHGRPEIGYVPVTRTAAGRDDALLSTLEDGTRTFNAHGDHVVAGPATTVLATSEQTAVHALRVGERAWGVQFHPEVDAAFVAGYVQAPGVPAYLRANGWEPGALVAEARRHDADHRRAGAALLGRWVDLVAGVAP